MPAPKGNQFWKMADPACLGRPRIFDTPKDLWEAASKYFDHCIKNPLVKHEIITSGSKSTTKEFYHDIPFTWEGLYVFLGVESLDRYKSNQDFVGIIAHIGNIIYNKKYSGAAAGLFNANIIARDLGLADKKELTGKDGGAIEVVELDATELKNRISAK